MLMIILVHIDPLVIVCSIVFENDAETVSILESLFEICINDYDTIMCGCYIYECMPSICVN